MLLQHVLVYARTTLLRIPDEYKVVNVFKVYKEIFLSVHRENYWPQYEGATLCHNESIRRKKKKRLNIIYIRNKMNNIETHKRK